MALSIDEFVERLTSSGLMSVEQITNISRALPNDQQPADAEALAELLVRLGHLTQYQASAVFRGRHASLVFHEYVILDRIAKGGMGVVFKARHRRMMRVVAIKTLPAGSFASSDAVGRFYREVQAAAKLSHPNIVTVHDASEHQGMHYLVMEYVAGKDLARVLAENGPLSVDMAVNCIIQAAKGLEYAHGMGVVHRDIKPGNLLLTDDGMVKVLDMGLARVTNEPGDINVTTAAQITRSGQVMGTVDYMSPEQACDLHSADHRSDIYSLGCTCYCLLVGEPPYQGDTLMNRLLAHERQAIPSLRDRRADVSPALDAAFQKMIAKSPSDRQQSMREVIVDLQAAIVDGDLADRGPPAAAPVNVPEMPASPPLAKGPAVSVPRFHRGGVVPLDFFIDREEELEEAEQLIIGGHSFLLTGGFREGKTSFCTMLIDHLARKTQDKVLPVYRNMQEWRDLTIVVLLERTIMGMLGEIAREIFHCKYTEVWNPTNIAPELRVDPEFHSFGEIYRFVHSQAGLDAEAYLQCHTDLMNIIRAKGWRRCVVIYDEANRLQRQLDAADLFYHDDAMTSSARTSVYVASPEMANWFSQKKSFHEIRLGPFGDIRHLRRLLARYCCGDTARISDIPADEEAVELLWEYSAGRPYLIQWLANEAFGEARREGSHCLLRKHVASAYSRLSVQ